MKSLALLPLLGFALLTGCNSVGTQGKKPHTQRVYGLAALKDDPRLGEEVNKICFTHMIHGFNSLDERTVILNRGVKEDYVVETYGSCVDLDYAWEIALASQSSCLRKYDSLIITRGSTIPNSDPFTRTCRIKSMHKWNKNAKKAATANNKTPVKD